MHICVGMIHAHPLLGSLFSLPSSPASFCRSLSSLSMPSLLCPTLQVCLVFFPPVWNTLLHIHDCLHSFHKLKGLPSQLDDHQSPSSSLTCFFYSYHTLSRELVSDVYLIISMIVLI